MEPGYGSVQVGRSIPPLFPPASGHLRIHLSGQFEAIKRAKPMSLSGEGDRRMEARKRLSWLASSCNQKKKSASP